MRPERLEICGIKSYTEKTVIEFNKLCKGGLFGIFGNTGSGKSAILDSILIALYGRTQKTSNASDFVSFSSNVAYVCFEFSLLEGDRVYYKIRHDFKLKVDRKIDKHKVLLSKIFDGKEIPIAETNDKVSEEINRIIGLNIDDFSKCIILPQGEFAQFVSQSKAPRLSMMSSLFNLKKYGDYLVYKIKAEKQNLESKIDYNEGQLVSLDDATKDKLDSLIMQIEELEKLYNSEFVKSSKIKDIYLKNKENYERHNSLKEVNKNLKLYEENSEKFSKLKRNVELFFKAQNIVILDKKINDKKKKIDSLTSKLKLLLESKKTFENKFSECEKNVSLYLDGQEKIKKYSYLVSRIEDAEIELKTLKDSEKSFAQDKLKIVKMVSDESKLSSLIEQNIKAYDELKFSPQFAELNAKLNNAINTLSESAINDFALSEIEFLKCLSSSETLNQSTVSQIDNRVEQIKNMLPFESSLNEALDNLNLVYNEKQTYLTKLSNAEMSVAVSKANLNSVIESRKIVEETYFSKQSSLEKQKQALLKIVGSLDFDKALFDAKTQLKSAQNLVSKYENDKKDIENELSSIDNNCKLNDALLVSENETLLSLQQEFEKAFEDIKTLEDAVDIVNSVSDFEKSKKMSEEYEQKRYLLNEKKLELEKQLNGVFIEDAEFAESERLFNENQTNLSDIEKRLYYLRNSRENLSQKFDKRCIIENDTLKLKKDYALYDALLDTVKTNKLVEFIADEYLKEIAAEAKMTLLNLTDGRFGLRYEGDFYIEDNLSGLEVRKADNVSGGELFLVSLSLALSLSKSIFSKSRRPIEFFFLDEGFGSLDEGLVETVCDSLMKLKSDDLTIGVISHVEALKERITTRITVNPATALHGSKVIVET